MYCNVTPIFLPENLFLSICRSCRFQENVSPHPDLHGEERSGLELEFGSPIHDDLVGSVMLAVDGEVGDWAVHVFEQFAEEGELFMADQFLQGVFKFEILGCPEIESD